MLDSATSEACRFVVTMMSFGCGFSIARDAATRLRKLEGDSASSAFAMRNKVQR
jgi:hypothetical protein